MGTQQLRSIYGGNSRQAMARAIRAEIEGGEQILLDEQSATMRADHLPQFAAVDDLTNSRRQWHNAHARRVEAENKIRAKYGMPLRGDSVALPPR